MDKQLRRRIMILHANGLSAMDIARRYNLDPRIEYQVTTMEIEDVLREQGVADPTQRIPQKPDIQPDMPKRFISISESRRQRSKHQLKKKHTLTEAQRFWHQMACGFPQSNPKPLVSHDRHLLERKLVEHIKHGWVQIGGISTDFDYEGEIYIAVVRKGDERNAAGTDEHETE